jgi:hypothetical protein
MLKKVAGVLLTAVLVFSVSTPGFAAAAKKGRVEGRVALTDKDKSTLTIREGNAGGGGQKTIHYDSSTKWNSQYHGDKNMNAVDPNDVKEGDYVTCVGSYDDKGEFHATIISKRLSHPK